MEGYIKVNPFDLARGVGENNVPEHSISEKSKRTNTIHQLTPEEADKLYLLHQKV